MSKPSELKRVSLTTISQSSTTIPSLSSGNNDAAGLGTGPAFGRFGGDFLAPEAPPTASGKTNATKSVNKSIRLKLELFETDSNKYPEFNYSKLVHLEKKKAKKLKTKVSNGPSSDPFPDNDDDVARIAKELEKKYGNAYASGRGRCKKDDLCDIGMGYDESDSFIDNTEAYDEVIPEEVETIEGGFYINCGALEFKNLTKKSNTTRTDEIIKMPERSRKRVLSTSSENSSSSDDDEDEDEEDDDEDDDDDSDSTSLEDEDQSTGDKAKKQYKNAQKRPKPDVAAKEKTNKANTSSKKPTKSKLATTSSSSNSPRPSPLEMSDTDERQAQALKKIVKTTTVKDMLKAKRDSFLKSQGDGAAKGIVNGEVKCTSTDVESSSENGGTDSATEQGARADKPAKNKETIENLRTADTILPATLDAEILDTINSFKSMVRSRDMCGKKFFFDDKLTALLLKVYEALLCTERNERNMVFAHLEYQLLLPKYFILRKSKALRSKEEKNKTTVALDKLRKAIEAIMPKIFASYEMELHKFAELQAADVNAEQPPKMPRKKFQWTNELRECLYEVYQARWTSYAVLGKRKDSLVEFINGYLKEKVVDLWPSGWMRYEELQREIERHKSASRKAKDKTKKAPADANAAELQPTVQNCLKQYDELTGPAQSRSRANSDTDSATSASSNSLKRKMKDAPAGVNNAKQGASKPPKKKAQKLQQHQHQMAMAAMPNLDALLAMPSTSAQGAALSAAAAAGVLDLASPPRRTDHSIFSIMTAATLANAAANSAAISSPPISTLHSKTGGARPLPHIINLDDYKCPSDILQTSKQLTAANYTNRTDASKLIAHTSPANIVRGESSSESDGVEFVGVYPAAKTPGIGSGSGGVSGGGGSAKSKANAKNKTATAATVTGGISATLPNGPNGALGFSMENLYIYNNNNNNNNSNKPSNAIATGVRPGLLTHAVDLSGNPQIMKTLSDLKHMGWSAPYTLSPGSIKGAGAGTGTQPHQ